MPGIKPDVIEAEVLSEVPLEQDLEFSSGGRGAVKKPVGTRKKDFSKFTERNRALCVHARMIGMPKTSVAKFAKIHVNTLTNWLERGGRAAEMRDNGDILDPVDEDFADFYESYHQAGSAPEAVLLQAAMDHGRRDGTVAMALLKMINPEEYNTSKSKVEVEHGGTITIQPKVDQLKQLPAEKLRRMLTVIDDEERALPETTCENYGKSSSSVSS